MAAVLQQQEFCTEAKCSVPIGELIHVCDAIGNTLRMHPQQHAKIKAGAGQPVHGQRQADRQCAGPPVGTLGLIHVLHQLLKLSSHCVLVLFQKVPNATATLQIGFPHGSQITLDKRLHQSLDLKAAQIAAQKGDTLALFPGSALLKGKGQNGKQNQRVHQKFSPSKSTFIPP